MVGIAFHIPSQPRDAMTEQPSPESIFELALQCTDQDERTICLEEACGGNEELRREVESLLSAHHAAGSFLEPVVPQESEEQVPVGDGSDGFSLPSPSFEHYRILRKLGEGGMGIVYEAEQDHPHRHVALKVVHTACVSISLLRRFDQEVEVLGRLHHPGIAQIYEAGTADTGAGPQPYFAMELIEGQLLSDYARDQRLDTSKRLELLARICDAVDYAHQQGVVHRDLKPQNIMVDEMGQPKILDFGVARATDADLQTMTLQTEVGQVIGTLPYMAPEQARGEIEEIDCRCDVYALGVIAYELLSGHRPFDLKDKVIHEAVRVICEEEPTQLSSIDRSCRGDIETIVGKALAKERSRRYDSAFSLAADIRRFLHDEPIHARPPSTWYQLGKFTKRNKVLVGGVAAVLVALAVGAVISTLLYLEAEEARFVAEVARGHAAQRATFARNRMLLMAAQGLAKTKPQDALLILRELPAKVRPETAKLALDISHEALGRSLFVTERRLLGHSDQVVQAAWGPDGRRFFTRGSGTSNRLLIWNADGDEEPVVLGVGMGNHAAWSPDGKRIVTASGDGTARVWNADGRGEPVVLEGHSGRVCHAAWSPDGERIVTASTDGTARVWNADGSGGPVVLAGHTDTVWSAIWSPDGKRIVTASGDGTARVWNADGSGEPLILAGHTDTVWSAIWSPDGKRILTASRDKTARVWNADGAGMPIVRSEREMPVDYPALGRDHGWRPSATWSPDGKRIVTVGYGKGTQVWNADGRGEPIVLQGQFFLAWNPDSQSIVTSSGDPSSDHTAQVWRIGDSAVGAGIPLLGHDERVLDAAWSPDGKRIVTASGDKTARVWNADGAGEPIILAGHTKWSPDGKRIVTTLDGTVRVWDADGSEAPINLVEGNRPVGGGRIWVGGWSPNGKRIAISSFNKVCLMNSDGSGEPVVFQGVHAPVWSPDGKRIVTARVARKPCVRVQVWNADGSGTPISLDHPRAVNHRAWSPDGKRIVTASRDLMARVWNADGTGTPIVLSGHEAPVSCAEWSPDGKRIVTTSRDKTARVWSADGTAVPIVLEGHTAELRHAVWSPDGKRIVTASRDKTARIWNADGSGTPIVLTGHTGSVDWAAWTPDGNSIVTASRDGTIRFWSADGEGDELVFRTYVHPKAPGAALTLSPDGKRIVTTSRDGTAWVRTIRDWPQTRALLWERLPDILTRDERIRYLGETPEEAQAVGRER